MAVVGHNNITFPPWTRHQPWTKTQTEMEAGNICIGSALSIWMEEYDRAGLKNAKEFALHLLETHRLKCSREMCRGVRLCTSFSKSKVRADPCLYKSDECGNKSKISDNSGKEIDMISSTTEPEVIDVSKAHGDPYSYKSNGCEIGSKMCCKRKATFKEIDEKFSSPCRKNELNTIILDDSITLGVSEDVNYDIGVTTEDNISLFDNIEENFVAVQQEGFEVANQQDDTGLFLFEEDQCLLQNDDIFIPIPDVRETKGISKEDCSDETNGNLPNFTELLTAENPQNVHRYMEPCKATRVVPKTQIIPNRVFPTSHNKPVLISSSPMSSATQIVKRSSILPSTVRHANENVNGNASAKVTNDSKSVMVNNDSKSVKVNNDSKSELNEKVLDQGSKISGAVRLAMKEAANNTQDLGESASADDKNSYSQINGKPVHTTHRNHTTSSGDRADRETLKENRYSENLLRTDVNNSCVAQILKGGVDKFNCEKRNHLRNKENVPALETESYQEDYDIEFTNKVNNFKGLDIASKADSKNSSPSNASTCDPTISLCKSQNSNSEVSKYGEFPYKDKLSSGSQFQEGVSEKPSTQKVTVVGDDPSTDNVVPDNRSVTSSNMIMDTEINHLRTYGRLQDPDSHEDDNPQTENTIVSPINSVSHSPEGDNTEVLQDENPQSFPANTSQLKDNGPQTENCAHKSPTPQDMMVMAEVLLEISRSRPQICDGKESGDLTGKTTNKRDPGTSDKDRFERCGRRTLFKRRRTASKLLHNSKLNMLKAKNRTIPKTYSKFPTFQSNLSNSRFLQSRYLLNKSRVNKASDATSTYPIRKAMYIRSGIKTIPRRKKNKLAHQITLSSSEDPSVGLNTDSQIDWEHTEIILEPIDIDIREETILTTEFYPEHKELSARIRQTDIVPPLEKPKEIVGYTVTTSNNKKTYTCDFCSLSFPRLKDIETHIKESYDTSNVQTVAVVTTNDNPTDDKDRKDSVRKRTLLERSFVCAFLFCDQTFVTKKDYKKHVSECHLSNTSPRTSGRKRTGQPSVCLTCGNMFSSKRRLHLHVKNCHPTKPNPIFKNRLKDKSKTSLQQKGKQNWPCKYCDLSFVIKRDLNKHLMNSHPNLKPQIKSKSPKTHTCNFCQQNFQKRKLLVDHLQLEHNHPPGYAKPAPKANNKVPKLKAVRTKYCRFCELSFMDKKLLDSHLIEDHKIKPGVKRSASAKRQKLTHRCGSCDASFSWKDCLQKHWREDHKFFSILENGKDKELQTYQCSVCDFNSSDNKLMENHLRELHNFQLVKVLKAKNISCCICDVDFKNDADLRIHFKDIHFISITGDITDETSVVETENTLRCKICDLDLSENDIFEHMKSTHPNDINIKREKTTYKCKYCDQTYVTKKQLNFHVGELHAEKAKGPKRSSSTKRQKAEPVTHYCNFCELSFMKKRELKLHTAECHDKPKVKKIPRSYQCDFCEQAFPKRALLSHHVKTDHPAVLNLSIITGQNEDGDPEIMERDYEVIGDIQIKNRKIFTCDFCTFMFVKQKLLHAHIKECHKDCQYQCGVCGKLFTNKSRWNAHLKLHQPDPPFKCDCGKAFPFRYLLNAHIHQVHAEVKKHMCDYCGKTFSAARILRDHLLTHTKEQPFVCEVCNKGFTQAFNLKRHLWTHTGEKPYTCNVCLKSFRGSTDLKRHSLIHVCEKPHRCELCDLSFRQLSHLNTHRKKQHKRADPYS